MCGIAGVLAPGRASAVAVAAMGDVMAHRGPDGSGVWSSSSGACALGHRRLAILELSELGAQPMVDEAAGLTITYNGEIYNYVELRERLIAKGHTFRTHSDTEVLLRAYVEWGVDVLTELNGMFSFAIWDEKKGELFCARDRFGEKPFHYAWVDGAFVFASEVKALATIQGVDTAVDGGVLSAHILHGSTALDAFERTLLRGVRQLLPAHALLLRRAHGSVVEQRRWAYWEVSRSKRHEYGRDDLDAAALRLRTLLGDSVRLRLRSDVRVGSCLSGGLDSSTIVALMRELEPTLELRTFTGRFPGDPLDEGRYAKMVVSARRTTHFEVEPSAERFLAEASKVYWHADFPIGGMSQFAQFCVFGLARDHDVTVLLDGQGSDEQLGGYGNSITSAFLRQLLVQRRLGPFVRERRAAASSAPALFSWPKLFLQETPLRVVRPLLKRTFGRSTLSRADFYRPGFVRDCPPPEMSFSDGESTSLSNTLWSLSFRTMLSSLLRFGDRLSMAHSREVRLPFCDHRVAELAFSLSPELLVGNGEVKRVLRRAIVGLVPDQIVRRPKQGFVPPQSNWLVGPLASWVSGLAADSDSSIDEALNLRAVRQLVQSSEDDRRRDVSALWDVANVMAWSRYALLPMRGLPKQSAKGGDNDSRAAQHDQLTAMQSSR